MKKLCIKNAKAVLENEVKNVNIILGDGKILNISDSIPEDCDVVDAEGKYVTPGIIELHSHGAGGFDFCDLSDKANENIAKTHLKHGVTLVCPTLMSASFERIKEFFDVYRRTKETPCGRLLHKVHLEGPYLSPLMCGAQRPDIIRCPSKDEVDELYDIGSDIIGRIGIAPEIDGVEYLTHKFRDKDVIFSIAHSNATAEDVRMAMDMGFNHVTHLYSATTTVRKINQRITAGILEAAYLYDDINIELIGDGRHVAKETLKMAVKVKGADKINLTSDSMRAAGQSGVSESYLGDICPENRVIIHDKVAKLPDMSFYAGSIATGDWMMRNAVVDYEIDIVDAVKMLCSTPARLTGEKDKGVIASGKDADIVIWNDDFSVNSVYLCGEEQKLS